ncbi:hypothetical protein GCM10009716_37290 [Streptomyces sodiiphilus]|uniref:Secreted protein n=1 Tax=Streptomyces sodiiphilus TaxID=226217 RepID=A0ABN2PN69_9ACTN
MEIVLAVVLLSFVMFVALTVRAVRAVKRGVERTGREVRRSLSDTALRARAAQPGLTGEVARTRRELRSSIDSTRAVLRAGSSDDPALREALGLLDQLHGHARQLDRELDVLMAGEPDRARIAARLPELRERADRIRNSADSLRFAAQDRAHRHDTDALDALHQQIDIEAGALRHWAPATPPPDSTPPVGPEPGTGPARLSAKFRRRPQGTG